MSIPGNKISHRRNCILWHVVELNSVRNFRSTETGVLKQHRSRLRVSTPVYLKPISVSSSFRSICALFKPRADVRTQKTTLSNALVDVDVSARRPAKRRPQKLSSVVSRSF